MPLGGVQENVVTPLASGWPALSEMAGILFPSIVSLKLTGWLAWPYPGWMGRCRWSGIQAEAAPVGAKASMMTGALGPVELTLGHESSTPNGSPATVTTS